MPILNITNLLTSKQTFADPSGLSNFSVDVAASATSSNNKLSADTLARVQPILDAAVTASRISYTVAEDGTSIADVEKFNVRTGLVSPITATKLDEVIVSNLTVAGAVTVTLPSALPIDTVLDIVDGKGDAGVNNITIDPEGAGTINGAATLVLSANYASARLVKVGATAWLRLPG